MEVGGEGGGVSGEGRVPTKSNMTAMWQQRCLRREKGRGSGMSLQREERRFWHVVAVSAEMKATPTVLMMMKAKEATALQWRRDLRGSAARSSVKGEEKDECASELRRRWRGVGDES